MEYTLQCTCGAQVAVDEGSAGAMLPCDCGKILAVPSLHELRQSSGIIPAAGQAASSVKRSWGDGHEATQSEVDFAVNLINNGASYDEVHSKLVERGLDQATATALVRDRLFRILFGEAATMLQSGASPAQVEQWLLDWRLDPQLAKEAIDNLLAQAQAERQAR